MLIYEKSDVSFITLYAAVCTVQGLAIENAVIRSHCDAILLFIARPFSFNTKLQSLGKRRGIHLISGGKAFLQIYRRRNSAV